MQVAAVREAEDSRRAKKHESEDEKMATGYTVTPQQLLTTADALEELRGRYHEDITFLCDKEEELRVMWEGEANETFRTAFYQGITSHNSFDLVIRQYIDALRSTAATYMRAEQQASDVARNRSF